MIALLLGGASSGKSGVAERLAASLPPPTTYVATWVPDEGDPAMVARVAAHRQRRPAQWRTLEVVGPALVPAVAATAGTVLIDALGTWVAGAPGFDVDAAALTAALTARDGDTVVVSDEVGLGVHPATEAGRSFREALGLVNTAVAAVCDHVWLVVAGRLLTLDRVAW
jgi:adenosyl cobinamide kinase/adenosyl cobinamide phosphate guanylyltransferase